MPAPKGHPKWGGRTKGKPNKATADIRALASVHGPMAIETLVSIVKTSDNPTAQIAAAKELLDRGFGRATQPVNVNGDITHHHESEPISESLAFIAAASGKLTDHEAPEPVPSRPLLPAPVRVQ